mgnify:CR=1 FL=1
MKSDNVIARRKFPIGVQSFEDIRREDAIYVDKTAFVYRLVSEGKYYFLARPRRFGKSLFISTLEAYFKGRRELFEGLAIDSLESAWQVHAVLRFDFSRLYRVIPVINTTSSTICSQGTKKSMGVMSGLQKKNTVCACGRSFEKPGRRQGKKSSCWSMNTMRHCWIRCTISRCFAIYASNCATSIVQLKSRAPIWLLYLLRG